MGQCRTPAYLQDLIKLAAAVTHPKNVVLCDGSQKEFESLVAKMLKEQTLIQLNQKKYPNCFLHRSHKDDVARTEETTYICTEKKEDAGPTNRWMNPQDADKIVWPLFKNCMRGRTMYVVPFMMGPKNSPYALPGLEITDSPYVVANMHILVRVGRVSPTHHATPLMAGIHSLGTLDPHKKAICHFPETNFVWSINSGYGGNALLGKKSFALRLASFQGRKEGWLAEHMMVLGLEDPSGKITYIAGAFPSACGKTNFAMLSSHLPGYRIWTVSDDICWMHVGEDGRLWAINPENGFFAVAPGTGPSTNPNMLATVQKNTIFTNTAMTPHREPWWEGIETEPSPGLLDWQGKLWTEKEKAAHPNARFTTPAKQCPSISLATDSPQGVPISAILFGGREGRRIPLIYEAFDWQHGMFMGLSLTSETTAASAGTTGVLRRDPYAMLPFTGYHLADSVTHRLEIGKKLINPPKIFHINVFRKDREGKFMWPGFKENVRLLKWVLERTEKKPGTFRGSPLGLIPEDYAIDDEGLKIDRAQMKALLSVDRDRWKEEVESLHQYFREFGDRMPQEMWEELNSLKARLG